MISSQARLNVSHRRLRMMLALPAAAAAAAVLAACSSSSPPSGTSAMGGSSVHVAAAGAGLKTAKVGGATVLTNGKGFTLYAFAPDTPTKSNCNGPCAQNWPPVKSGTASAVKGQFATIKRSTGSTQLTFEGHPLYTFVGDQAPGQANGNGLIAFGGRWYEATTSGTARAGHTTSGSGGGTGY